MNLEQLLGNATRQETIELAQAALLILTLDDVIDLIGVMYDEADRAEISLGLDAFEG